MKYAVSIITPKERCITTVSTYAFDTIESANQFAEEQYREIFNGYHLMSHEGKITELSSCYLAEENIHYIDFTDNEADKTIIIAVTELIGTEEKEKDCEENG